MIPRLFSYELITTSLPHTKSCLCTVYTVYYNYLLLKYVILDSVLAYGNFYRLNLHVSLWNQKVKELTIFNQPILRKKYSFLTCNNLISYMSSGNLTEERYICQYNNDYIPFATVVFLLLEKLILSVMPSIVFNISNLQ